MSATDRGYLFGCCAACRAPFEPARALTPEEQSVLYMISRFNVLSASSGAKSGFTGKLENSHLVTRARYSGALQFAIDREAADVDKGLSHYNGPATDRIPNNTRGTVFVGDTNSDRRNEPSAASGDAVADAVREAIDDAGDRADSAAVGRAAAQNVSLASGSHYRATWGEPETSVEHKKLFEWLSATELTPLAVDLDRTAACCSLCNDIWDCFARMRHTVQDPRFIKRSSTIAVQVRTNKITFFPNDDNKSMNARLGCMVAYHLHACLRKLRLANPGAGHDYVFDPARRSVTVMLLWLPLHINCMYRELQGRLASSGAPAKGFHNYVGCLDLLISYYVYLCACADPDVDNFGSFPFERFHVFYMKELAECPPPSWPSKDRFPRVHEFVFGEGYNLMSHYHGQVSHVSDNLQALYHDVAKPLVQFAMGRGPASPALQSFFLSHAEAQRFAGDFAVSGAADVANIQPHLKHAGVHAVMWQLRRALNREPAQFGRELDKWINARMQVEWRNMVASGTVGSLAQAQLVYFAQHTAEPSQAALAAGAAEDDEDEEDAGEAAVASLRARGLCSIWKAAMRLRAWHFTAAPELEPMEYYEVDDDGGLASGMGRLRIGDGVGLAGGMEPRRIGGMEPRRIEDGVTLSTRPTLGGRRDSRRQTSAGGVRSSAGAQPCLAPALRDAALAWPADSAAPAGRWARRPAARTRASEAAAGDARAAPAPGPGRRGRSTA
jgi:hypothetical protein